MTRFRANVATDYSTRTGGDEPLQQAAPDCLVVAIPASLLLPLPDAVAGMRVFSGRLTLLMCHQLALHRHLATRRA